MTYPRAYLSQVSMISIEKKLNYMLIIFTKLLDKAYVTFMIFRFTDLPNVIVCRIKSFQ